MIALRLSPKTARFVRMAEVGIGFVLPLIIAGPFIAIGIVVGLWVLILGAEPIPFLPAIGGLLGLMGVGQLFFREGKLTQRQAEIASFEVVCGFASVVWLLLGSIRPGNRMLINKEIFLWFTGLTLASILGLRRAVLVWRRQPQ